MVDKAVGNLAQAADAAVETLKAALTAETDSTRVSAAKAILDRLLALRNAAELETRILSTGKNRIATLSQEKADVERGRPPRAA